MGSYFGNCYSIISNVKVESGMVSIVYLSEALISDDDSTKINSVDFTEPDSLDVLGKGSKNDDSYILSNTAISLESDLLESLPQNSDGFVDLRPENNNLDIQL
ncbi:hypothetical protein BB560_004847 [Smittium megazygosporum]|uniref:Uncharacterized protein n=1 Tax=Smittium megazygosporum TaxID=133381 RepID=A0A2T9Z886_9FUNG|nr:hypothetical protein BB560_004847 [Smittium megazygosporum]